MLINYLDLAILVPTLSYTWWHNDLGTKRRNIDKGLGDEVINLMLRLGRITIFTYIEHVA